MSWLQKYLLSVVSAALLLGVSLPLLSKGKICGVLRFLGGLVLILSVVSPLVHISTDELTRYILHYQTISDETLENAEKKNREILSHIIKERCETYILDKAKELGAELTVEIYMREDGEYPYPDIVEITGAIVEEEKDYMKRLIEQDLGIPQHCQEWKESG